MNPETRTLLSVKLEDIAECEAIFTTLMVKTWSRAANSSRTTLST